MVQINSNLNSQPVVMRHRDNRADRASDANSGNYDTSTSADSGFYSTTCNEATTILSEIEERAGPRSLVIVAIVSSEVVEEVQHNCQEYGQGTLG
jgi:hypothetical protein